MYCRYCGQAIPDNAAFCHLCGKDQNARPDAQTPAAPTPVAPTPVAPTPISPTPAAPTPAAPTPAAPTPAAPSPVSVKRSAAVNPRDYPVLFHAPRSQKLMSGEIFWMVLFIIFLIGFPIYTAFRVLNGASTSSIVLLSILSNLSFFMLLLQICQVRAISVTELNITEAGVYGWARKPAGFGTRERVELTYDSIDSVTLLNNRLTVSGGGRSYAFFIESAADAYAKINELKKAYTS